VRDGLARHVADGEEHVLADGRRQVDEDHACVDTKKMFW
jgi:hypothetical protein